MTRHFGLGSKPDRCRLSDRAYIPVVVVAVSVVIMGLGYLLF
jgi:hypothetical protein